MPVTSVGAIVRMVVSARASANLSVATRERASGCARARVGVC